MIDRLERLTNLVANLLATKRPLTLEEIVELVPGYPTGKAAYRRQFERDKDTLRGIGVPVSLETVHDGGPEIGYRIPPDLYYLPKLDLTKEEQAALHVAVTAVRLDGGEDGIGTARGALRKLGGLQGEAAPVLAALPTLPELAPLFNAYRQRASVTFSFRGKTRQIDPWGILFRHGHWYVIGHDHDRDAPRSFRVDRINDVVLGTPGSFELPQGLDPGSVLRDDPWNFGNEEPLEARVLVDAAAAPTLVAEIGAEHVVERNADGSIVISLSVTNRDAFRSFVLDLLDHAEVLEPAELRADIVDWLESLTTAAQR